MSYPCHLQVAEYEKKIQELQHDEEMALQEVSHFFCGFYFILLVKIIFCNNIWDVENSECTFIELFIMKLSKVKKDV